MIQKLLKQRGHSNPTEGVKQLTMIMEPTLDEIAAKWHCGKCFYLSNTEHGPNRRRVTQAQGSNSFCTNKKSRYYNRYRETNQDGCGVWKKWKSKII